MARIAKLPCLAVLFFFVRDHFSFVPFVQKRIDASAASSLRQNLHRRSVWLAGKHTACLPHLKGGLGLFMDSKQAIAGSDTEDHPLVGLDVDIQGGDGEQTERVVLKLHPEWAPRGVRRFVSMLRMGDLEGSRLHHVASDGVFFGLPAEPTLELDKIRNDRVRASNVRGTVSFKAGGLLRNSHSRAQELFVNTKDNSHLDKDGIAPIAEVVEGMETIDKVFAGYGRSPDVQQIKKKGITYLDTEFPKLGKIVSVYPVELVM